jgi:hypothetical protein
VTIMPKDIQLARRIRGERSWTQADFLQVIDWTSVWLFEPNCALV